jgi:hypothetical protein
MTYACPASELEAETYHVKWQRLLNKVLRTVGNVSRFTLVRDVYAALNLPYVYDYITKLCRQQTEILQNHENERARSIGQGEATHRIYKGRWSNLRPLK